MIFKPEGVAGLRLLSWRAATIALLAVSLAQVAAPNAAYSRASAHTTAASTTLGGVACPSATSCFAVGDSQSSPNGNRRLLIEHSVGTAWSTQSAIAPAGSVFSRIFGVRCPNTKSCVAVGLNRVGSNTTGPLIERWNGSGWSLDRPPRTPSETWLNDVACPSTAYCVAVGIGPVDPFAETLVERWNGTSWKVDSAAATGGNLFAVTCASPGNCFAVGDDPNAQAIVEHLQNGQWTRIDLPDAAQLDDVSCTAADACAAVGIGYPDGLGLVERWNGTHWSVDAHFNERTNAIVCPGASDCWVVGYSGAYPTVEHWDGRSWTMRFLTRPTGSSSAELNHIACAGPSNCHAVGSWENASQTRSRGLVMAWNGHIWTIESS